MIDLEGGSLMMNSRRPIRTYSFIHGKYIDIRRRLKPEMVAHHPNLGPGWLDPTRHEKRGNMSIHVQCVYNFRYRSVRVTAEH
jgi:hypothetical protein